MLYVQLHNVVLSAEEILSLFHKPVWGNWLSDFIPFHSFSFSCLLYLLVQNFVWERAWKRLPTWKWMKQGKREFEKGNTKSKLLHQVALRKVPKNFFEEFLLSTVCLRSSRQTIAVLITCIIFAYVSTKHAIPNDKNACIVTISWRPVVHAVCRWCWEYVLNWAHPTYQLSVHPELIESVELLVRCECNGIEHECQWQKEKWWV